MMILALPILFIAALLAVVEFGALILVVLRPRSFGEVLREELDND